MRNGLAELDIVKRSLADIKEQIVAAEVTDIREQLFLQFFVRQHRLNVGDLDQLVVIELTGLIGLEALIGRHSQIDNFLDVGLEVFGVAIVVGLEHRALGGVFLQHEWAGRDSLGRVDVVGLVPALAIAHHFGVQRGVIGQQQRQIRHRRSGLQDHLEFVGTHPGTHIFWRLVALGALGKVHQLGLAVEPVEVVGIDRVDIVLPSDHEIVRIQRLAVGPLDVVAQGQRPGGAFVVDLPTLGRARDQLEIVIERDRWDVVQVGTHMHVVDRD